MEFEGRDGRVIGARFEADDASVEVSTPRFFVVIVEIVECVA